MNISKRLKASAIVSSIIITTFVGMSSAQAGAIYLTGHDILSHSNQNNYDDVVLNYLRGAGTTNEIAAADYNIGLVSSGNLSGFGTVTTHSSSFATGTDFSNYLSGYYDWLPLGVAADGQGINQSTGFTATAAGTAIGITSNMINGFPTHSRFTSWDPAFTVLETHTSFPNDAVSLGIQEAKIINGSIITDVPEPSTLAIFALGMMGLMSRRFKKIS